MSRTREFASASLEMRRSFKGTADRAVVSTLDQDLRTQVLQPNGAARATARATSLATGRAIAWAPRWTGDGPRFVDELVGWLLTVGRRSYGGHVTLLEHALQSAALAKLHGARHCARALVRRR